MNWFVYFLKLSNGHIYVGSTNDVDRRLKEHQSGGVKSTKTFLPADLMSFDAVTSENHA